MAGSWREFARWLEQELKKEFFNIDEAVHYVAMTVAMAKFGIPYSLLLVGPPGTGKTDLAMTACRLASVPYTVIVGSPDIMPKDVLGDLDPIALHHGARRFLPGPIFRADPAYLRRRGEQVEAKRGVVIVDEFTQLQPICMNAFNEIMAMSRVTVPRVGTVPIHVNIIACANAASMDEATHNIPDQIRDRFRMCIFLKRPSLETMHKIAKKFAKQVEDEWRSDGYEIQFDETALKFLLYAYQLLVSEGYDLSPRGLKVALSTLAYLYASTDEPVLITAQEVKEAAPHLAGAWGELLEPSDIKLVREVYSRVLHIITEVARKYAKLLEEAEEAKKRFQAKVHRGTELLELLEMDEEKVMMKAEEYAAYHIWPQIIETFLKKGEEGVKELVERNWRKWAEAPEIKAIAYIIAAAPESKSGKVYKLDALSEYDYRNAVSTVVLSQLVTYLTADNIDEASTLLSGEAKEHIKRLIGRLTPEQKDALTTVICELSSKLAEVR